MISVVLAILGYLRWYSIVLMILSTTISAAVMAQTIDPHGLFETRCGRCHDHAGNFVRGALLFENAELIGKKSGRRLISFLPNHFGNLNADEIGVLVEAFERQVQTDGLYQEKCRICHDRARDLARRELVLREDQLIGRYTGADIRRFFTYHGRLSDEQQKVIYDMLVWQLTTAPE